MTGMAIAALGAASPAHARDDAATAVDSADITPVVTVSKAADAVGTPVDIVAATMAMRAEEAAKNGVVAVTTTGSFRGGTPWGAPVSALRVSSRFGLRSDPMGRGRRMHSGTDFAAAWGTPVHATSDGIVTRARPNGGYGLFVALDHGGATQTRYGHLSRIAVGEGQRVRRGQIIGYVGSTGRSTGPHLHYEVRRNGIATDPASAGAHR